MRRHAHNSKPYSLHCLCAHPITQSEIGIRLDELWSGPLLVLWLYLPGYLANTAAMLGGKWIPDLTGIEPRPIDGGSTFPMDTEYWVTAKHGTV